MFDMHPHVHAKPKSFFFDCLIKQIAPHQQKKKFDWVSERKKMNEWMKELNWNEKKEQLCCKFGDYNNNNN